MACAVISARRDLSRRRLASRSALTVDLNRSAAGPSPPRSPHGTAQRPLPQPRRSQRSRGRTSPCRPTRHCRIAIRRRLRGLRSAWVRAGLSSLSASPAVAVLERAQSHAPRAGLCLRQRPWPQTRQRRARSRWQPTPGRHDEARRRRSLGTQEPTEANHARLLVGARLVHGIPESPRHGVFSEPHALVHAGWS